MQPSDARRRADLLAELAEHPDLQDTDPQWLGQLDDEDLDRLLAAVGDPERLQDLLDELSDAGRER